jgi:hypothetical protein
MRLAHKGHSLWACKTYELHIRFVNRHLAGRLGYFALALPGARSFLSTNID